MTHITATKRDFVLDVGSGHYPHSTADVLVERFLGDTEHRSNKKLVRDRPLVCADIQALPFKDNSFDYVISNHVVEHVDEAAKALSELSRVGKRGYLGVPSEFYEFICPTKTHRWVFAYRNGLLLVKPKQERHGLGLQMYGGAFHMLYDQADFRRLVLRRPDLFGVAFEWEGSIPYQVYSEDEQFYNYHDPASFGGLLQPVPPDDMIDGIKRWLKINFELSRIYKLSKLRTYVRQFLKRDR